MTYYIEIPKSSGIKRKAKFWESDVTEKNGTWRIEKLKDEKDADKTVHKRATRKNYRDWIIFFSVGRRLSNFSQLFVFIGFHSI